MLGASAVQVGTANFVKPWTAEEILSGIESAPVHVTGSGRTDAGVHALAQVAAFDLAQRRQAGARAAADEGGGQLVVVSLAGDLFDVWVILASGKQYPVIPPSKLIIEPGVTVFP